MQLAGWGEGGTVLQNSHIVLSKSNLSFMFACHLFQFLFRSLGTVDWSCSQSSWATPPWFVCRRFQIQSLAFPDTPWLPSQGAFKVSRIAVWPGTKTGSNTALCRSKFSCWQQSILQLIMKATAGRPRAAGASFTKGTGRILSEGPSPFLQLIPGALQTPVHFQTISLASNLIWCVH